MVTETKGTEMNVDARNSKLEPKGVGRDAKAVPVLVAPSYGKPVESANGYGKVRDSRLSA